MANHHYMFPRATELKGVRPAAPTIRPLREGASLASERRWDESSPLWRRQDRSIRLKADLEAARGGVTAAPFGAEQALPRMNPSTLSLMRFAESRRNSIHRAPLDRSSHPTSVPSA
jgi:hypothetical protein